MVKSLDEVIATLPQQDQRAIADETIVLLAEVESLKVLRELAKRSQRDMAHQLGIKQPAVHKMEHQADLYLSSLRRFVEAAGGTLELQVRLPGKGTLRLTGLADLH